jgi:glutamate 5-kinase
VCSSTEATLAHLQVIKIGTSSLVNEQFGTLNLSGLSRICEVVRDLQAKGEFNQRLTTIREAVAVATKATAAV